MAATVHSSLSSVDQDNDQGEERLNWVDEFLMGQSYFDQFFQYTDISFFGDCYGSKFSLASDSVVSSGSRLAGTQSIQDEGFLTSYIDTGSWTRSAEGAQLIDEAEPTLYELEAMPTVDPAQLLHSTINSLPLSEDQKVTISDSHAQLISPPADPVNKNSWSEDERRIPNHNLLQSETFQWIHYNPQSICHAQDDQRLRTTSNIKNAQVGRGRQGPLEAQNREKVAKIRTLGACWWCRLNKKPCDDGTPCRQCMLQEGRKALGPCSRTPLEHRSAALIPSVMVDHQNFPRMNKFLQVSLTHSLGTDEIVQLTFGCINQRAALPCVVRKFLPDDPEAPYRRDYQSVSQPVFVISPRDLSLLCQAFDRYLGQIVNHTFDHFRPFHQSSWPCPLSERLLPLIYRFFRGQQLPSLLQRTLKLLVLVYTLGHNVSLNATAGDITEIIEIVDYSTSEVFWGHLHVATDQIKLGLQSLVRPRIGTILKELQTLLCRRRTSDWPIAFCTLSLLAMICEEIQVLTHIVHGPSHSRDTTLEADRICATMEEEGFDVLIALYKTSFRAFTPLAQSWDLEKNKALLDDSTVSFIRELRCLKTTSDLAPFAAPHHGWLVDAEAYIRTKAHVRRPCFKQGMRWTFADRLLSKLFLASDTELSLVQPPSCKECCG